MIVSKGRQTPYTDSAHCEVQIDTDKVGWLTDMANKKRERLQQSQGCFFFVCFFAELWKCALIFFSTKAKSPYSFGSLFLCLLCDSSEKSLHMCQTPAIILLWMLNGLHHSFQCFQRVSLEALTRLFPERQLMQ